MRLVSYRSNDELRLGAVVGSVVVDLQSACAAWQRHIAPPESEVSALPADMLSYLQQGVPARRTAQAVLDWLLASGLTALPETEFMLALSDVQLGPPIPNPGKVIGIGLNYADHAREQNLEPPKSPIIFAKFATSVIGPGEAITWLEGTSDKVDYEAELAVVIGSQARNVSAASAYQVIAGYTIANDVTARDAQVSDGQWVRGKSFDTFCPLGPYLLTADEIEDPYSLRIRCLVNDQVLQDSHTGELIFDIPALVEFISRTSTLMPGDVICTGTPGGVGVHRQPPVFLKPGDLVQVEIEKLGVLSNPVQ